jgi:DNA replication protein DnaC
MSFDSQRPNAYIVTSVEASPRPAQFQFVVTYWSAAVDDERDRQGTEAKYGLLLFGASRTGKTAAAWEAASRFAREIPTKTRHVEFCKSVTFSRLAKARHLGREASENFAALLDVLKLCDLLVLDDLGTEKLSESAEEVLYELIDSRMEDQLHMIITTNCDASSLAKAFSVRNEKKMLARIKEYFQPVNFDTLP